MQGGTGCWACFPVMPIIAKLSSTFYLITLHASSSSIFCISFSEPSSILYRVFVKYYKFKNNFFLHFCNVCNVYIMYYVFFNSLFAIVFITCFWDIFSLLMYSYFHPFCTGCLLLLCFVRLWSIHERFSHLGAADCGDNFVFPSPLFSCLIRLGVFGLDLNIFGKIALNWPSL